MSQCAGIKADGGRCRGTAIDDSGYCYAHHPDMADQRKIAAHKGGKSGGRGRKKVDLSSIKSQLQDLIDGVLDGSIARADAAVVTQTLNVLLRATTDEWGIRDKTEWEERLKTQERLKEQEIRRRRGATR